MGLFTSCFLMAKQLRFVVWDIWPLLGHVRDRNFVRPSVHIRAGSACTQGRAKMRSHLEQPMQQTGGRGTSF